MKKILVWVVSALLTLTCLIINPLAALANAPSPDIYASDPLEARGAWKGKGRFYAGYGCPATAGKKTLGMNNVGISGKEFITFERELIPGEYTATIDVCDYTNYPYTRVGQVGMTAGGVLLTPTSSTRPTPSSGQTVSWSFKYSVPADAPNLGSPIGFEINVPRGGKPVGNVAFDNLQIKTTELPSANLCENTAQKNLIVNGSFETPVVDLLGFEPSIEGWTVSEGDAIEIDSQIVSSPSEGAQFVELDGNQVSKIEQDIPTQAGKTYKLSFAFSPRPGTADNKLNVRWGDKVVAQLDESGETLTAPDWKVYSYEVKADGSTTRLSFDDLNEASDGFGTFLDAASVKLCQ
ncbi:MAG: DUF642 domain-containing protein [Cyanobacteriota bacterium]|nr:DUF642 domain-containing protein [Cyanobacteriota bacterium]